MENTYIAIMNILVQSPLHAFFIPVTKLIGLLNSVTYLYYVNKHVTVIYGHYK